MSHLTENPELMLEVLAVLVKRAGGTVTIDETPGPFNLMTKWENGRLYIVLDDMLTREDVDAINAGKARKQ